GQSQRLALFGVKGRPDRTDQVAGQGAGGDRRIGQLRHPGGGEDRIVRADEAGAHRLYAVENPDEPLRRGRRDRGAGGLARLGGLLVLDRRGVRYFRRTRGVLRVSESRPASKAERRTSRDAFLLRLLMSWRRGAHHATAWRYLLNLEAYQALDHTREILVKP